MARISRARRIAISLAASTTLIGGGMLLTAPNASAAYETIQVATCKSSSGTQTYWVQRGLSKNIAYNTASGVKKYRNFVAPRSMRLKVVNNYTRGMSTMDCDWAYKTV